MRRIVVLLVCAIFALVACGSGGGGGDASSDTPVKGGIFTVGILAYPESFDPAKLNTWHARQVATSIFDTLLTIDESGTLKPLLATDFSSPDDGKSWVFKIRQGVTFQDGTAFNAAAVVAHMNRLMDPNTKCACATDAAKIATVQATGEDVTFTLKTASASFPALLAGEMGMITAAASTPTAPIGAGPFKFSKAVQGDSVEVVAYDKYWQADRPYLNGITYKVVPDVDTRLGAVRSGGLDAFYSTPYARWDSVESDSNLKLVEFSGLGSVQVLFNMGAAPFNDLRARQAVAYALDVQTLHKTLNAGKTDPATSIFNKGTWAYPGEIGDYPKYDLAKAKKLVQELGGLSFTLLVPGPTYAEQAVAAQSMWAEAGIKVEVKQGEAAAIVAQYRAKDYQAAFTSYSGRIDPQNFAERYISNNPFNYSALNNAQLDALVKQADATTDRAKRKDIYKQIATIGAQQMPFLIVNNLNDAFVINKRVHGVVAYPDGLLRPTSIWLSK